MQGNGCERVRVAKYTPKQRVGAGKARKPWGLTVFQRRPPGREAVAVGYFRQQVRFLFRPIT